MKKFLIILCLFCLVLPAFAANWIQYNQKGWYDISSWQRENNIVTMWFKDLNPGNWELVNKKKVWFELSQMQANCNERKIQILNLTQYDLKGNVIDSFSLKDTSYYEYGKTYTVSNWNSVIPDTVGEEKYLLMCSLY